MAPGAAGQRAKEKYLSKLSGPLLDRIDIHIEAPAVPFEQLAGKPKGTTSAQMRDSALRARRRSHERQGPATNSKLSGRQLDKLAPMPDASVALLKSAVTELKLSARAYDKVRRIARTVADLDSSDTLEPAHVAEAIGYRLLDRRV